MGGEHLIDALDSLGSPGPPATLRPTNTACSSLLRNGTFLLKNHAQASFYFPPGHWTNDEGYVIPGWGSWACQERKGTIFQRHSGTSPRWMSRSGVCGTKKRGVGKVVLTASQSREGFIHVGLPCCNARWLTLGAALPGNMLTGP